MHSLEQIINYWPFFVSVGGLTFAGIAAWINLKRDVKDVEQDLTKLQENHGGRIDSLENKIDEDRGTMGKLEITMGKIETKIDILLRAHEKQL